MMKLKTAALAASLVLAFSTLAQAGEHRLSSGANDQIPARLVVQAQPAAAALDRTPVQVSWALDPTQALAERPQPFVQESREYWLNASEAELQRGVNLPTTAESALIRLSPHRDNSSRLVAADLVLRAGERSWSGSEATVSVADEAALRAAGMDVPEGTVIAKLAPRVGKGNLQLAAPAARGSYLIHVFEPTSSAVLRLGAARDTIVAGQSLRVDATLQGARGDSAKGLLTAPDGHTQPFELIRQADGSWRGDVVPDASHAVGPGLWEVHAFARGGDSRAPVLRDAKTAFALAVPTARLTGAASSTLSAQRGGLSFAFGVEAASASRYQLAGVLYGTAADGSRAPVAYAQSAAWLDNGNGQLSLVFEPAALAGSRLAAPYELRDLRLSNQADLSLIERRERAFEVR